MNAAGSLEQAIRAFEGFHWGEAPRRARRVELSPHPRHLVQLGQLERVVYSASKGGQFAHWDHPFEGRRPVLAMDPQTERLHIVGGSYRVEDRGIVG